MTEKSKSLTESDVATLPENWVAYLTSRLETLNTGPSTSSAAYAGSSAVTAAMVRKVQSLHEENEELYAALSRNKFGQLKDEVNSLKTTVSNLEVALKGKEHVLLP